MILHLSGPLLSISSISLGILSPFPIHAPIPELSYSSFIQNSSANSGIIPVCFIIDILRLTGPKTTAINLKQFCLC
jgi:hypothetical protein